MSGIGSVRGPIDTDRGRAAKNGMDTAVDSLANDFTAGTLIGTSPPCLSLYQPTHRSHPDNRQDSIRFRNLVKVLEASLRRKYSNRDVAALLEPVQALAADREFWNHARDGLAVLRSAEVFRVYRLQRPVGEVAIAADSFHVKPLIRILQSADRYQVLGLSRKEIKLFEGNRDVLDEIELEPAAARAISDAAEDRADETYTRVWTHGAGPSSAGVRLGVGSKADKVDKDTERFFRAVDRAVLEHYSRPSALPLLLAALPEHHAAFRAVSRNGFLLDDALDVYPDALSQEELTRRAWSVIEPHYLTRLAGLVEMFGTARSRELGTSDPAEAAYSAAAGRVATVLIDADRHVPGRIDAATGYIVADELDDPATDDLLDDIGESVLVSRGQVIIVPNERMPTDTGIAAIYRY
jgi:hypothetical protein